jgi:hypothetical protein
VNLLVAEQVDHAAVFRGVCAPGGARFHLMLVKFFLIEETLPADRAPLALVPGELLPAPAQGMDLGLVPVCPVDTQPAIVRRGRATDQHMPVDVEPLEFAQIPT